LAESSCSREGRPIGRSRRRPGARLSGRAFSDAEQLTRTPVSRLAAGMSEGDHLRDFRTFAIYDHVREPPERNPARFVSSSDPGNLCADGGEVFDRIDCSLHLSEKCNTETGTLAFIPRDRSAQFLLGVVFDENRFGHLRRRSTSIRRRTSSQPRVVVVPASRASHRRSISAAHASSTSSRLSLLSASRLAISRVAISALSSSGSFRASCSTLSAVEAMSASYQHEPEQPSSAPNKPIEPDAKRTRGSSASRSR